MDIEPTIKSIRQVQMFHSKKNIIKEDNEHFLVVYVAFPVAN
jgi:hypothetical protein